MKNIFKKSILFSLLLGMCLVSSCEDDDKLGQPDRLFRPVIGDVSYSGTWIKLKWDRYVGADQFLLELSTDSFANILRTVTTDSTQYTFQNLDYDTSYQLRLKSMGNGISSSYFVQDNITTLDFPTKLITPGSEDVVDVAVRVKWAVTDEIYDSLVVFKNDSLIRRIDLTPEIYGMGEHIVSGLQPATGYFIKAYAGGEYKGKKSYRTSASQNFDGAVVDLRAFSASEAYQMITQEFIDSIESGSSVIMNGGTTYLLPTLVLSKDITFVTGLSLSGKARFAVEGNFDIEENLEMPISIVLKDLFFTDSENKPKTSSDYGGTYLFNLGKNNGLAREIIITGCDIRYKRGIMRIKSPNVVDLVKIENTVCDSIGGYGVINVDHAAGDLKDLVIKNSTFSHCDIFLVNGKGISPQSVTIENVTTFQTPAGGKYFIDFNKKEIPGGLTIRNCVFGVAKGGASVKGLRSTCKLVTLDKNYRTNDLKWTLHEVTGEPIDPLDITLFDKSAYELFVNPDFFDLTIAIKDFPGEGDPRWK